MKSIVGVMGQWVVALQGILKWQVHNYSKSLKYSPKNKT